MDRSELNNQSQSSNQMRP